MDELDIWRLSDQLTVSEAAHLFIGIAPGRVEAEREQGREMPRQIAARYQTDLRAALTAISGGLRRQAIKGTVVPDAKETADGSDGPTLLESIDVDRSTIEVDSLRHWLRARGVTDSFFYHAVADQPDFLDQSHQRYAPKLAAAVSAWQAVTNPGTRSVKQALEHWLREHAIDLGLVNDEGELIKLVITD